MHEEAMRTKEEIISETIYVPLYIDKVLKPEEWMINSEQLIKTANEFEKDLDILWGPPANYTTRTESQPDLGFVQGIYFMLIAYAIENIAKAAFIRMNKGNLELEIKKKKKLPEDLSKHNLVKLVRDKVGIRISVEEEELLLRLAHNAVWAARYPVPLFCKDITNEARLSNGQKLYISYFHRDDIKRIKELINRLSDYTNELLKN